MKSTHKIISKLKDERGVSAIVVAVVLVMLIGFLALAIDIGYLYATKNELQNTADAAALAGAGELGHIYKNMTSSEIAAYDCNIHSPSCATIKNAAKSVVGDPSKNLVAGKTDMVITDDDITIFNLSVAGDTRYGDNLSEPDDITFQPDAVRVIVRREGGTNGPIVTFFARIFGIDTADVTADATAALTGVGKIDEGGLPIPVGIAAAKFFDPEYCWQPIKFYPTNDLDACGGWHVYDYDTYLEEKTKIKQDILDGLLDGADPPFISSEAGVGDVFYYKGGTDNAAYTILKQIFDERKDNNDADGDGDPETWTTTVVVYDWDDCSNPNTNIPILGFAKIRIYEICTATSDPSVLITGGGPEQETLTPQEYCVSGEKQIVARIVCELIEPARGGGGEYGIMGSIPGLIE